MDTLPVATARLAKRKRDAAKIAVKPVAPINIA